MQDDVPEDTKRQRLNEAISVYREVLAARNSAEVGRRHLVLLEGPSLRDPAKLTGDPCLRDTLSRGTTGWILSYEHSYS